MKRLDEVEARTIVNATNCPATATYAYGISAAQFPNGGSFYLTANLVIPSGSGGILISANNVTLDLNGFSIVNAGSTSLFSGIFLSGANASVTNGAVSGPGFSFGVSGSSANNRVQGLNVSGATSGGISLSGAGSAVHACAVNGTGGIGIRADVVSDSTGTATASTAILAKTASNVAGTTTGGGQAVIVSDPQNLGGRTAIPGGSAGYTISAPGSYYLAGNVAVASGNAIVVTADDVQIDLNGFTISSTSASASGAGIAVTGSRTGLRIGNGFIKGLATFNSGTYSGGGFLNGIDARTATNALVEKIAVDGVTGSGIQLFPPYTGSSFLAPGGTVRDCTTNVTGVYGISAAVVTSCYAYQSGLSAIVSRNVTKSGGETSSSSSSTSSGDPNVTRVAGILSFGVVSDSVGHASSGGIGIYAGFAVNASWGQSSSGTGIQCITGPVTNSCGTSLFGPASIDAPAVTSCVGSGAAIASPNKYNTP